VKSDPLWTCPKCGHAFVSPNLWHSCGRYELDDHFRGRPPGLRRLFDRFRARRAYGYYRVVSDETGLDDWLQQYLREARAVGCQEHHAG
jgi:hypothetical protein